LKLFPLDTSDSLAKVWKKWMALDLTTRTDYFQRLLIYLLDRKPGRALRFIQVLAKDSSLQNQRNEAIADALGYLSKIHITGAYGIKQNWHPDPEAHKRLFAPAFVKVYDEVLSAQPDVCSQDLLHNMIELAGPDDLKKVFDCLVKHRTKFGFETLLHYAGTFGEAGEVEYALRCLHELRIRHNAATWNKVVERPRLRFTCATILRKSMSASQDYHQTPTIVAKFVHLRIKMDILLYNVVMHNAMEAGDYATAFKVYNALDRNELEADKYTYSILLHGCALQNNPATFRSFAEHAVEVAKEIKDPWLATDYLYYLYVRHHADEDIGHTSALLWEAYCKLFSVAPLEPFLSHGTRDLRNASEAQRSGLESTLLSPPPVALYIMLQMEIRSALAISNQRVLSLYHNFKSLVNRASNPTFKTLVQNPTIWNAFLLAFCQKQQFASASQLIKDMTDGPIQPNVYSWNIFMQAFFKTGQIQAADRVFEIMRNRGIDPDQFTYGVLLRGYAKAQLVDRIGDIMPHVEREEEMDPDLLRALATVVDRNKLMATLEKGRIQKEATEQEEANREAEEERLRWDSIPNYIEFDPEVEGFGFLEDPTNVPSKPTPTFTQQAVASDSSDLDYIDEPINKSSGISESILEEPQIDRTVPAAAPSLVPETQTSNVRDTAQLEPKETPQPPPQSQKKWQLTPLSLPSSSRNPQDPETQYRMLQEQLGVIQPSPQPSQATFPSATLGLKSVRGGDGGISKVLPKFTIRKTMSSDRSEGPKDEASTAKRSKGRRKR
jgi:pentatricopeptide repeat protein